MNHKDNPLTNNKGIVSKKTILFLLVLLFIVIGTGFYIWSGNNNSTDSSSPREEAPTTSTVPTAQPDFSNGDEREPGNTFGEDDGQGLVRDTGGSAGMTQNMEPIISESGEISVYQPGYNSVLKSGGVLTGESELDTVTFRIIDDVSGVIGQGNLKVSSSKFSGTFEFKTRAKTGRIDVFGIRPDGTEFSNIEIPVRFE